MAKLAAVTMTIGILYIYGYWFKHPQLTEMQVFLEMWPAILVLIVMPAVAVGVSVRNG